MVRFLDVASLLFFSYIAVVAADSIPRVQTSGVVELLGRFSVCSSPGESESYDDIPGQLAYSLSA